MKKLLAVILCLTVALVLVCCADKKDEKKEDKVKQDVLILDEEPKEETKQDEKESGVEINIKPLGEVDVEVLKNAASSLGFENEKLFHAFANAIGKNPFEVTQADVDKVHYIAVGPEGENAHSVFVGHVDYVDMCFSEEASNPDFMSKLNEVVMISEFNYDIENDTLSDLGNFKNIEMFEIYNVNIDDVSFIKEYSNLALGYFNNNGITDVSSLEGYNPKSLIELDFTNNDIEDWTPLYPIKEKIIVYYGMNGELLLTLEDYIEQKENPVEAPEAAKPSQDETELSDDEMPDYVIVDADGNPADFSSLFD